MVTVYDLRATFDTLFGDNLRYVYRHYPLSFHEHAMMTAEASEAAGAQGKFWELHDLLYERQGEWIALTPDQLEDRLVEYAGELGLDTARFAQELRDHTYVDKVNADLSSANAAALPGTPSYVVNGVVYPMDELGFHPVPISGFIRLFLIDQYPEVPAKVIDPQSEYVATIETTKGDIVVELFAEQAPVNVNNFVFLAWNGWYDGQMFFFVDPASAAYSGDPTGMGWGLSYPGYTCGSEFDPSLTFDEAGMLAFYASTPDHNSSLFFITYAAQPGLTGQFTIIGRVLEGMDVAESLTPVQPGLEGVTPDAIVRVTVDER